MAISMLKKQISGARKEKEAEKFIAQGGSLVQETIQEDDHRLTLRIPKWLMARVDAKRKERVGTISRNLWILEVIEKASK
jgi:hypothetical protein